MAKSKKRMIQVNVDRQGETDSVELPLRATGADLLTKLGLEAEKTVILWEKNGETVLMNPKDQLRYGDELLLLPVVGKNGA